MKARRVYSKLYILSHIHLIYTLDSLTHSSDIHIIFSHSNLTHTLHSLAHSCNTCITFSRIYTTIILLYTYTPDAFWNINSYFFRIYTCLHYLLAHIYQRYSLLNVYSHYVSHAYTWTPTSYIPTNYRQAVNSPVPTTWSKATFQFLAATFPTLVWQTTAFGSKVAPRERSINPQVKEKNSLLILLPVNLEFPIFTCLVTSKGDNRNAWLVVSETRRNENNNNTEVEKSNKKNSHDNFGLKA